MRSREAGRSRAAALLTTLFLPAILAPARAETGFPATTAQTTPAIPSAPTNRLDATQMQLRGVTERIETSDAKRKALAHEISDLETDRAKFQAELIETTRKVAENEAKVDDARNRLDVLSGQESATKRSLEGRRAVVAEVLAALQRMGRRPPPALLVAPDDVLKAIRTSMLLGTLLPGMRREVDALAADLTNLTETRRAIEEERGHLDKDIASLADGRLRLTALIDARQAALGKAKRDMDAEQVAAGKLASEAGSLKDLISGMERESAAASRAAEAARKSDEQLAALMPNGAAKSGQAPARDPARLAPAVAFATMKGQLPRPVSGQILRRFGQDDGLGSAEKGELSATGIHATIAAPADGWVAFAGPYRSFGKLLILNAGGGYYIVLAGMERINVDLGQFVLAGEPIATMGDGSTRTAAAVVLGAAQPVLYVEFRKDGATIDPGPWWARPEIQKVRG